MNRFYEISISKNGDPLKVARLGYYADHETTFSLIMNPPDGLSSRAAEAIEICIASNNGREQIGSIKVETDTYIWRLVGL